MCSKILALGFEKIKRLGQVAIPLPLRLCKDTKINLDEILNLESCF